jgi:SlyX protein
MNKEFDELKETLIDLQIRLTHQEDHIHSLDKIIYQQDQQIAALADKIKQLENKLKSAGEANILSAEEESPPPHY